MDYALVVLIGLAVGSFVNVLAYRVPLGRSVVGGRSECPSCNTVIAWYDLVPVLSFILLNARCRRCRARISFLYPLGELLSGLIFLLSFYFFRPLGPAYWLFSGFILEIFLILFLTDLKYLVLPDIIILAGLIAALAYGIFEKFGLVESGYHILSVGNIVAAIAFSSVLYFLWFGSNGKWLGLGDAKLAGLIGLVFGYLDGLSVIYLAVLIGGIIGAGLLVLNKANLKTKLPLGSFICLAAALYIFTGLNIAQILKLELIF